MKIFYGVQGTGNGHITRARIMAPELYAAGCDVTFLFSGRSRQQLFDMEIFKDFQCRQGLTFNTGNGRVRYVKTALQTHPLQFIKDIKRLDLSAYDLVISDFEPITAWAARCQKKPLIGIGHQYAFRHDIPVAGSDPLARQIMNYFAPVNNGLGLHWFHFDQPLLPPVIATLPAPDKVIENKIVVYLPFENPATVIDLLHPFTDFVFHIYAPQPIPSPHPHIQLHPLSRNNFQKDLYDCAGIISNAGFELASEALQLGKKILAKPLQSQMEQISNAAALRQLNYGHTLKQLNRPAIEKWLHHDQALRITYPNVARHIVHWIKNGIPKIDIDWTDPIWQQVRILPVKIG